MWQEAVHVAGVSADKAAGVYVIAEIEHARRRPPVREIV